MTEEPTAVVIGLQLDAPKTSSVNVGDLIMLRESFVEKCVVRMQQVREPPVLPNDAVNEQFCLHAKCLPQIVIEVREKAMIGGNGIEVSQIEPLTGEVCDQ